MPSARRLILALDGYVMDTVRLLAKYVLCLEQSSSTTARAEDRSVYARLMADAGPLLAAALQPDDQSNIATRVSRHERLWGNLWLQDPVFQSASDAWQAAKVACTHAAI